MYEKDKSSCLFFVRCYRRVLQLALVVSTVLQGLLQTPIVLDDVFYYYRPQRSCGQGNIFTRVCDSDQGVLHGGIPPPEGSTSPPSPGRKYPPPPPRKEASPPRYGQWAAGTHPTGMHSCDYDSIRVLYVYILHLNHLVWSELLNELYCTVHHISHIHHFM